MRSNPDWALFIPAFIISLFGLVTMNSFSGESSFFSHQIIWLALALAGFSLANSIDWRFLNRTRVVVTLYATVITILVLLFSIGHIAKGAQRWISLGAFAFQPSDLAKFVIILLLAKYFSRRHIEIGNIRHIIVSGVYALIISGLVFLQPNFSTAVIILAVWFGMVLVSGISKKHILGIALITIVSGALLWSFALAPYQKGRIMTFLNPLTDIHGAGYNAYQSTIAVGSGQILGKGIGLGSQSKLSFLPEYQTDFIFAAFAEEWGFVGTLLLLLLAFALIFRIIDNARRADSNFETLFGLGVAILFSVHIAIHAGMNMGLLPVTGIVFPFMSYGGSHLLTEWFALGILSSMKRNASSSRT